MENEEKGMVVASYSVTAITDQINQIQKLMRLAMTEGEHYGIIPGTKKKSLYKPGAEKLSMMFRLSPKYKIETEDLGSGHKNITVSCTLIHIPSDAVMGEGVGSCSTMESKYRYRNISDYDILDVPIPNDAKDNKPHYRKMGFGMKKDDELGWVWVKFRSSERQENPDIADVYNTVLKMAKKRAHTDAILTVLAASDIFTQDYDEDADNQEPSPPSYDTEASAQVNIKACQTSEALKSLCSKYKADYKKGITGWNAESWNRLVAVMTEVKNNLSKTNSQEDEQITEVQVIEEPGDDIPPFMR